MIEEKKIKALLQLLDDPDEEIFQSIQEELIKIGKKDFLAFEKYKNVLQNDLARTRFHHILNDIQGDFWANELLEWRKKGGENLLEGWILLSKFMYPNVDFSTYKKKISGWVHQIWLQTSPGMKIFDKIKLVSHFLFNRLKFQNNLDDIENPKLLFINHVIDLRKGSTLSLSILTLIILQQLEVYAHILSFQHYYAIRYLDRQEHYYFDTFNPTHIFTPDDVKFFLLKMNIDDNLMHYKPLSNIYLILNLLEFASLFYLSNDNDFEAQRIGELLLKIEIKLQ